MKPDRGRGRGKGKGRGRGPSREKNAGPRTLRGKGRGGGNPKRDVSGGSKPSGATATSKTATASKPRKAKQTCENQLGWGEWTEEEWAWDGNVWYQVSEPVAYSTSKTKKPQMPKPKRATKTPMAAKTGETKPDASNTDDALETQPPKKKAKKETQSVTEEKPSEKKKKKKKEAKTLDKKSQEGEGQGD